MMRTMLRTMMHGLVLSATVVAISATSAAAQAAPATKTVTRESAGTVGPNTAPTKKTVMPTEVTLHREVFDYAGGGRRDPPGRGRRLGLRLQLAG